MGDVFISYKREDQHLAAALADHLKANGYSVWWDISLIPGDQFNQGIASALAAAKCVIVLWSERSHASQYVQAEALEGFNRNILVAARLDEVTLIYPFGSIQTADLREWCGDLAHPGLAKVVEGVAQKVCQPATKPAHYPNAAPGARIAGRPSRDNDPSIWKDPAPSFDFQEARNFFRPSNRMTIIDGPRAYARFIPAGWNDGPLDVAEFGKLAQAFAIGAPSNGYGGGTCGFSYFGGVQCWFPNRGFDEATGAYTTANACLYFDETGEFWIVHGTAFEHIDGVGQFVLVEQIVTAWSKTLRQAMKIFDEHGAHPERRVELGVVGLHGALLPAPRGIRAQAQSRKASVCVDQQRVGWSQDQQLALLRRAYNEVRGAFSLHKLDDKQFLADVQAYDSARFKP